MNLKQGNYDATHSNKSALPEFNLPNKRREVITDEQPYILELIWDKVSP